MDASAIAATAPVTGGKSKSAINVDKTFDQFLTLLTAQLRHQDPLSPMDSSEFTAQLVQFSIVEQSIRTNDQLETLIELQQNGAAATALGYIGHTVEVPGDQVALEGGRAEFAYVLDGNAGATAITVTDPAGQLVYAGNGETTAGKHRFVWDGTSTAGNPMPDGTYRVTVGSLDLAGVPMQPQTFVTGRVTGVEFDESGTMLTLGTLKVPLDKVIAIHATTNNDRA